MNFEEVIQHSLKYIDDNLAERLDLAEISAHMGYSEYHFSRMFKAHMGRSVMDYVKMQRLLRAAGQIAGGSRIIDAALNCGYESHGGFTKAFRQEFGFTPALLKAMVMETDCLGGNAMDHIFLKKAATHLTKEELYQELKKEIQKVQIDIREQELENVFRFCDRAYQGLYRHSGDEYVTHPLNVALILAQMEAGKTAILSGLLCDVFAKTMVKESCLREIVSPEVVEVLLGLRDWDREQIALEDAKNQEDLVLVKLAERLHNMRTVGFMTEEIRRGKAEETIKQFLPLAARTGNEKLMAELARLSVAQLETATGQ